MAHSLLTQTAVATTAIPIATISKHRICAFHGGFDQNPEKNLVNRRSLALGLAGVVLGLKSGEKSAIAARRPPPPPPEEKKDPNVSGLTAKVLASKKRKEAMKQTMAKLRDEGKPISDTSE